MRRSRNLGRYFQVNPLKFSFIKWRYRKTGTIGITASTWDDVSYAQQQKLQVIKREVKRKHRHDKLA